MSEPVISNFNSNCLYHSRQLDFWLLGGLSLLCWLPLFMLQILTGNNPGLTITLSWVAFYLAYLVNYPHFMASYKLAYTQGRTFVLQNWFQLLVVPLTLLVLVGLAFDFWHDDPRYSRLLQGLNNISSGLGLETRFDQSRTFGEAILGLLVNLMFFSVGWHYAKQAFGCMMVYAHFDRFRLGTLERNLIRYTLLSTWWVTWLNINTGSGSYLYYGLDIFRLNLPPVWLTLSYGVTGILLLTLVTLMITRFRNAAEYPSLNFTVPLIALMIWHLPILANPQYFYFLAFFHSLQYLPFVARMESRRSITAGSQASRRLPVLFAVLMLLGFLSFDLIPNQLDKLSASYETYQASVFMIIFLTFINIHHYFIDNVLWRFKNPEVRKYLLDPV